MEKPIIEARNISKKYNITHQRGSYVALRDVLMNILKSPFSFLKSKVKQVAGFEKKEEFWALKDLSFKINKGEVVGIIGANGAGKSTLLKILSQITPPTTGEIILRGRVGSLLEVGTGFHPELTGRENIFLNGAILGMKKKEIVKKFDQIVEFAGIRKFLDTPVKHYSSGMYVRLAFSVAAHMEPDILLVDEVLAVGDAEFQKKCLGKMDEITKKEGRTILFVSHNMAAIGQLCSSVILLDKGKVIGIGPTKEIIGEYLNKIMPSNKNEIDLIPKSDSFIYFSKILITDNNNQPSNKIEYPKDFYINLELDVIQEIKDIDLSILLKNSQGIDLVFASFSDKSTNKLLDLKKGKHKFSVKFSGGFLLPETYSVRISVHHPGTQNLDTRENVLSFSILNTTGIRAINYGVGCVSVPNEWQKK